MEIWFNRRLDITKKFHQADDDVPLIYFDKIFLTHLDIAPRNLIIGPDSKERRSEFPEYTDTLLETISYMISEHEELFQQLRSIAFALTTGQWLGRERLEFGQI
ncbi:uncharacterized protein N7529_000930 [Penicillium soppii]|uniref:uncharacterized protein n=1 Tax=Penicillium soppii TaxID=69789 RepID=UPI00254705D7|nr:uncharacterized protein N7529_000930 [Penicillium soppii]KAJ5882258.1 hypothetical protein N7529_000930 [Penicillium soppii]